MRELLSPKLTMGRVRVSRRENRDDERNATYIVIEPKNGRQLTVIISDTNGWDRCQISVYGSKKWEVTSVEVSYVRDLVFKEDDVVVEYHMKPEGYINVGDCTRNLWRNQREEISQPPLEIL